GEFRVLRKEGMDGVKFVFEAPGNGNGAWPWILFRASGTEPLLRLYAEAASPELTREILASGEAFVNAAYSRKQVPRLGWISEPFRYTNWRKSKTARVGGNRCAGISRIIISLP